MRLNLKNVSSLTVPSGKSEVLVWDDDLSGFGMRMQASGTRTWFVQYRTAAGQRRTRIGRFPLLSPDEARAEAKKILAPVMLGQDPGAEKIRAKEAAKITLGSVADSYLLKAKERLRPRSYEECDRHLNKHWLPLRNIPLDALTRRDIANRLEEIGEESGPIAANRARSSLSAVFTWAITKGLTEKNPVIGTEKTDESDREHVLTKPELVAIWHSSRDDDFGRIVKLLILTGTRRDEAGGMTWAEFDEDQATWTIAAERSKNHEEHLVPLSKAALSLVGGVPKRAGRALVFGEGEGGFSGWSKSKQRLDDRIEKAGLKVRPWRLHDLRRTVATMMADELGVAPHVIETVLNHRGGFRSGVGGVYNRASYMVERRQALQMWGEHLEALIGGRQSNVIPINREVA